VTRCADPAAIAAGRRGARVAGLRGTLVAGRRIALVAALLGSLAPAIAVAPLVQHDVVLLQPGTVLVHRVAGVDAMASYVQAVGEALQAVAARHPEQIPAAGFVVVAARPDGQTQAWLDFRPSLAEPTARDIVAASRAVTPPAVSGGPIVFALRVSLWGAKAPAAYAPSPAEWRAAAAAAGRPLATDDLLRATWPD